MAMQKKSVVTMPEDGLVWSISGKTGETVESNKLVMEMHQSDPHLGGRLFRGAALAGSAEAGLAGVDPFPGWHRQPGQGELESIRAGVGRLAYDTTVAVPPPEMAKRQIAVRVEAAGIGRSLRASSSESAAVSQVTFLKTPHERTVGDALKERLDRAIWGVKGEHGQRAAANERSARRTSPLDGCCLLGALVAAAAVASAFAVAAGICSWRVVGRLASDRRGASRWSIRPRRSPSCLCPTLICGGLLYVHHAS